MTHTPDADAIALCELGAVDFAGARREYGLARSYLYEQIANGAIRTIRRGRRRLIPRVELVRHLAQHLEPARNGNGSER